MLGNLYANSGQPLAGIAALEHAARTLEMLDAAASDVQSATLDTHGHSNPADATALDGEPLAILETHVYNNLAVIHHRLGDLLQQRMALDRAYTSSKRVADPTFGLTVLQNLSGYYIGTGDTSSAEQCLREIIDARGVPPELRTMAVCDLARVHYLDGELDRAEAEAKKALAAARKAHAPGVEARALKSLAYILTAKNKPKKAKTFAERALDAARRAGDDGLVIAAEIQLADAVLKDDPGSDLGYELLRSAGRQALSQRDALELLDQGEGFHRTVKELAGRIIAQAVARGLVDDAWQACEAARAHLLLKQLAARRQLKARNEMVEVGPPNLDAVRAALDSLGSAAVLIGYHIGKERSWLFIVRPSDPVVVIPVDMTRSRLEKVFRNYDREIRRFQTFGDIGEQWLQEAAPLVTPLEQHLRNGDHLVVLPDGLLFALPWHAMAIGGHRIGERWPVSYLPAASLLLSPMPPRGKPNSSAVLASVFREEAEVVGRILGSVPLVDGTKQDYLAAFSSAELIHVSMHGAFSAERPEMSGLVVGDPARFADFYAAAAKPPYARTQDETNFILSAANADELKKGLITATDLEAVELQHGAMVVLSACESGLSLINEAADPIGLVRALLLSGAQTIVAAFWRVEPAKTAELMQLFYEALSDCAEPLWNNPAEALRRAQVALTARYPHPFYWAPFYMIGGLRAGCAQRPRGENLCS
jgi:CHAT domain-containing protein